MILSDGRYLHRADRLVAKVAREYQQGQLQMLQRFECFAVTEQAAEKVVVVIDHG